ncbi:UDP-N-acetylglucosamine/UDP-glucose/GDP-mannose transporter-like isoform X2 [Centruroides sculpturatus]|uniref:UDP-N-acetylglucosamine/UDP-glucose/GDP-mannose transporter-like isoform X2 n=1 Tax=Centruroides sculpturatus TaxID=218467 RepID=UPI000C6DABC5|nr:UDP-N-acetylglucosamine/UDP-glucose/GDP-mannose transporter-like isoform X2 [Centruroides sculpturatus]
MAGFRIVSADGVDDDRMTGSECKCISEIQETVQCENNQKMLMENCESTSPLYLRVFSALLYGFSSFLIIVINKIVLTTYKFPSVHALGIGQMIATIVVLYLGRSLRIVSFPSLSFDIPNKIWPIPLFYVGNLICGLGGTKHLSLPMFTVLRRFTILMTLVGEYIVLKIRRSSAIISTVFAMIGGAIIAAIDDLSFDLKGYVYVLGNDFFTTANNIYVKKKLETKGNDLGKYGLLFYNALFMIVPLFILTLYNGDFEKTMNFSDWNNILFVISFILSCIMGFFLMFSTIICTQYNSALTTTIVGCLKNILVTYMGMYIGGDYMFSWTNFIGLNISIIGSLVYTYLTFVQKEKKKSISTEHLLTQVTAEKI